MSFSMVNGITTIHLDAIGTLALALVLLLLGNYLRNHVSFLERFCMVYWLCPGAPCHRKSSFWKMENLPMQQGR